MSNKSRRWKSVLTLLTVIALVATVYMIRHQLVQTVSELSNASPWPLLLLLPLTFLNHYTHAKVYQGLFRIFGDRFRTRPMIRLSLELNLINSIFPSGGVGGFSYLNMRMKGEGVTTGRSTFIMLMRFVALFVSFQVLLAAGLLMLAISGDANNFVMLVAGSLATLLVVGTAGAAYVVGSQRRIHSFSTWLANLLNWLIHIVRPTHPETINIERVKRALTELHECYLRVRGDLGQLKRPLLYAIGVSLTEVMSIFSVFWAFGFIVNPGAIIIAYAVANFASIISVLPGGVGIYEGMMTGVFATVGVPAAISLPVVVAYRVISMVLQLPIGYYFYHRALRYSPMPPLPPMPPLI